MFSSPTFLQGKNPLSDFDCALYFLQKNSNLISNEDKNTESFIFQILQAQTAIKIMLRKVVFEGHIGQSFL